MTSELKLLILFAAAIVIVIIVFLIVKSNTSASSTLLLATHRSLPVEQEMRLTSTSHQQQPRRRDVRKWVKEWADLRNVPHHVGILGSKGEIGRQHVQDEYVNMLGRSKIVVTCEPDEWEGDYRLQEAISSGAVVLSNRHVVPPPNVHREREFVSKDDLFRKLDALGNLGDSRHEEIKPLTAKEVFDQIVAKRKVYLLEGRSKGEYQNIMLPVIEPFRVDKPEEADIYLIDIIRVKRDGIGAIDRVTDLVKKHGAKPLVVLDWSDDIGIVNDILDISSEYWKRSQVHRPTQNKIEYGNNKIRQLFYPVKNEFLETIMRRRKPFSDRDIHVSCFH